MTCGDAWGTDRGRAVLGVLRGYRGDGSGVAWSGRGPGRCGDGGETVDADGAVLTREGMRSGPASGAAAMTAL